MRPQVLALYAAMMVAAMTGCGSDEHDQPDGGRVAMRSSTAPAPAAGGSATADLAAIQGRLQQQLDSLDRRLRRVPNLTLAERSRLRRDVNEIQIARARQLGVRVHAAAIPQLVSSGRLVELQDSTPLWVVRELDYSVPYVTPDAHAMLVEMGQRFQQRLDSLRVPRFRLDITSVLRTPEKQAELRTRNRNASRIESSHEFATTVDVAYRRFAAPAQPFPDVQLAGFVRVHADSMFVDAGRKRGAELQAILGRVIQDMQREGKVLVVMERSQTVYHMTVGRRFPQED